MALALVRPLILLALAVLVPLALLPVLARGRQWRSAPGRDWAAAGLRALISLALLLALAGAQLVRPIGSLAVVYVLDLSDSVPPAERQRAEDFIRTGIGQMAPGDRAAVVAFGANALVERLAAEDRTLPKIASVPLSTRTDIGAALRLGLALFPEDSRKRLVVLSDGLENAGQVRAELAASRGVEIDTVALHPRQGAAEAYVDRLDAPSAVRLGQRVDLAAMVQSSVAQAATLQVYVDGALAQTLSLALQPGANQVSIPLTAGQPGFARYQVELLPAVDTLAQNNTAAAFTMVQGPPRILLLEGTAGEAAPLAQALAAAQITATVLAGAAAPTDLPALERFDAVFLVNVPAETLPAATMQLLPRYVADLGRGLVMVGGPDSYGAGGYLRTPVEEALPVTMDVPSHEQEPNLALVLAVDKSGSMGRCHCDNPNLQPGQYQPIQSGQPKVDIAKSAILQTYTVLGRQDSLGVVAFDQNAHWAVPLEPLADANQVQNAISGITANGQTNVYGGLNEAEAALAHVSARVKHILLVTDGWSNSGSYAALVDKLQADHITLSIIAAGRGSAPYLQDLARQGGGRYYPAEDIQSLPQLFLKETVQAAGRYIVEEPFYPAQAASSPILSGVTAAGVPGLRGYNGVTPRNSARVALVSPTGDPVLAQWQYGLGRAVAWTSDLTGRWAADWLRWDQFSRFAGQMAGWVLPQPSSSNLQPSLALDGGRLSVGLDAVDEAGRPWNFLQAQATVIGPDLAPQPVTLSQVAPGRYEGALPATGEGTYLVQVAASPSAAGATDAPQALATAGIVAPYSPEYKQLDAQTGAALLTSLAQATGGRSLAQPQEAWSPMGRPAYASQPLQTPLLLLALLLFPIDIAVRRLRLTRRDWQAVRARLARPRRRPPAPSAGGGGPELLGDLAAARERARRRAAR